MKDSSKHRKLTAAHRLIVSPGLALVAAALTAGALGIASSVSAQPHDVLFIRGADRSGGFLEANNDAQRTEQLADINNGSTSNNNHGWKTLADTLINAGFNVSQVIEPLLPGDPSSGQTEGGPLNFTNPGGDHYVNLNTYNAVVFGSNNASYGSQEVDAVENYIRGGGGAIFISDANFGDNWADASDSDDPFLSRFGLTVNQDRGTYSLRRDNGEFLVRDHPILAGVDKFDGEGVTPITVGENLPVGVNVDILANAKNQVRRNNGNPGSSSSATAQDAALLAATIDNGRLIGHFDRNTFFNDNGAGTDITRFDNEQLAINMFTFAAGTASDDPDDPDAPDLSTIAINAGGSDFLATNGTQYLSDRHFNGGNTFSVDGSTEIEATDDDTLYRSERWGEFDYEILVENGTYDVTLQFAEIFADAAGERVFDVEVEGQAVLDGLDIFEEAGGNFTAFDVTTTVTVEDGAMSIVFPSADVDNAKLSALRIALVPEPGSLALLGLGGLALRRRRRKTEVR